MANIFTILFGGKFPSTAKLEAANIKLRADHKRFSDYENSERYKRFLELETIVHSAEFIKKVEELKNKKFKDTPEYTKYNDYLKLSKASDLKKYFKYTQSGMPEKLEHISQSSSFAEFEALNVFVKSAEYSVASHQKDFKKSEAYAKFKAYKSLRKDKSIKLYFAQLKSSDYANYKAVKDSSRLVQFEDLKAFVNTDEFKTFKTYMEDSKRYVKSQQYGWLTEYQNILKTPEHKWYEKTMHKNPFVSINNWNLTFSDDFDLSALDRSKWITGYYWGKALLNDTYVLADERQFFKDANITLRESAASLITKSEQASGKIWDAQRGFVPSTFDYTSALISTGQSFRQLYGKFEAKVKIDHDANITHAFWMVGEKVAPQIDVFRFDNKSPKLFNAGMHFLDAKNQPSHYLKQIQGDNFSSDYYIYTLIWAHDKLSWFINGIMVHEQTNNVPQEPMYLVLSSHILQDAAPSALPKAMKVDWVRVYEKAHS